MDTSGTVASDMVVLGVKLPPQRAYLRVELCKESNLRVLEIPALTAIPFLRFALCWDDIDYLLAHPDFLPPLKQATHLLQRHRLPLQSSGASML